MVEFETQVYHKEGTSIIGAEVIVIAETGERIDTLQIVSQTDFDELMERLGSLTEEFISFDDESPLAGMSIDEVLANSPQIAIINASQLGGRYASDYSLVGHKHTLSNITDAYNTDLSVSNMSPTVGAEITVTVTVTKTSNQPATNKPVVIFLNGASWKSGVTDENGVFSTTYTVENDNPFVLKTEQEKLVVQPQYKWTDITVPVGTLKVNPKLRLAEYYVNTTMNLTKGEYHFLNRENAIIPSGYRPARYQRVYASNEGYTHAGMKTNGTVWVRTNASTGSRNVSPVFLYRY